MISTVTPPIASYFADLPVEFFETNEGQLKVRSCVEQIHQLVESRITKLKTSDSNLTFENGVISAEEWAHVRRYFKQNPDQRILSPDDAFEGIQLENQFYFINDKPYVTLGYIGGGASGHVLALINEDKHLIYLKEFFDNDQRKLVPFAEFQNEAEINKKVGLYVDSFKHISPDSKREHFYLALEVVDGYSLDNIVLQLGQEEFSTSQKFRFMMELIRGQFDALARVHKSGIIHGDVQPKNFIAGPAVRMIDFDASHIVDDIHKGIMYHPENGSLHGSHLYFDPRILHRLPPENLPGLVEHILEYMKLPVFKKILEINSLVKQAATLQAKSENDLVPADSAVDIYALGASILHMFYINSADIFKNCPDYFTKEEVLIYRSVQDLCTRMINEDPKKRPSLEDIIKDFKEIQIKFAPLKSKPDHFIHLLQNIKDCFKPYVHEVSAHKYPHKDLLSLESLPKNKVPNTANKIISKIDQAIQQINDTVPSAAQEEKIQEVMNGLKRWMSDESLNAEIAKTHGSVNINSRADKTDPSRGSTESLRRTISNVLPLMDTMFESEQTSPVQSRFPKIIKGR